MLTIFGEIKMAGILRTIFGAGINALGFAGTNYAFSKSGSGEAEAEHKHHDLAEKKLQKANSKWNEDKIKQLDYINQRLCQKKKKKGKAYINKVVLTS